MEARACLTGARAARREQRARARLRLRLRPDPNLGLNLRRRGRWGVGGRGEPVDDDRAQGVAGLGRTDRGVGRGCDDGRGCGYGGRGDGVRDGASRAVGLAHGGGEAKPEGLDAADVRPDVGLVDAWRHGRD